MWLFLSELFEWIIIKIKEKFSFAIINSILLSILNIFKMYIINFTNNFGEILGKFQIK